MNLGFRERPWLVTGLERYSDDFIVKALVPSSCLSAHRKEAEAPSSGKFLQLATSKMRTNKQDKKWGTFMSQEIMQ